MNSYQKDEIYINVMRFQQSDELSLKWLIFIKVVSFRCCDRISSMFQISNKVRNFQLINQSDEMK